MKTPRVSLQPAAPAGHSTCGKKSDPPASRQPPFPQALIFHWIQVPLDSQTQVIEKTFLKTGSINFAKKCEKMIDLETRTG